MFKRMESARQRLTQSLKPSSTSTAPAPAKQSATQTTQQSNLLSKQPSSPKPASRPGTPTGSQQKPNAFFPASSMPATNLPNSSSGSELRIGDSVTVSGTERRGIVRFVGTVHFSSGEWVGIELSTPTGKNDGSVQGTRYFTVQPLYGLFVRSAICIKLPSPSHQSGGAGNRPTTPRSVPSSSQPAGARPTTPTSQSKSTQSPASVTSSTAAANANAGSDLDSEVVFGQSPEDFVPVVASSSSSASASSAARPAPVQPNTQHSSLLSSGALTRTGSSRIARPSSTDSHSRSETPLSVSEVTNASSSMSSSSSSSNAYGNRRLSSDLPEPEEFNYPLRTLPPSSYAGTRRNNPTQQLNKPRNIDAGLVRLQSAATKSGSGSLTRTGSGSASSMGLKSAGAGAAAGATPPPPPPSHIPLSNILRGALGSGSGSGSASASGSRSRSDTPLSEVYSTNANSTESMASLSVAVGVERDRDNSTFMSSNPLSKQTYTQAQAQARAQQANDGQHTPAAAVAAMRRRSIESQRSHADADAFEEELISKILNSELFARKLEALAALNSPAKGHSKFDTSFESSVSHSPVKVQNLLAHDSQLDLVLNPQGQQPQQQQESESVEEARAAQAEATAALAARVAALEDLLASVSRQFDATNTSMEKVVSESSVMLDSINTSLKQSSTASAAASAVATSGDAIPSTELLEQLAARDEQIRSLQANMQTILTLMARAKDINNNLMRQQQQQQQQHALAHAGDLNDFMKS